MELFQAKCSFRFSIIKSGPQITQITQMFFVAFHFKFPPSK